VQVAPRDLTAQLLFDAWQLKRGMREFTVMRVGVSGIRDGQRLEAGFDLMDTTDPKTGDFSMARTTGWPAILIARALASGQFAFLSERSGIMFPEQLATDAELFRYIIDGLGQAGVRLRQHPAPGGE
jgi:saccharopine dehydrogenase-like NADP-dependent oxidoreductase